MNTEHITGRRWYLARYNTSGKNREMLFHWLGELQVIP
ncbi:transcription termination factor NusG, partial [Salmonella enterica]|nr:transcription termination factor NusG [Salmonella enterica]